MKQLSSSVEKDTASEVAPVSPLWSTTVKIVVIVFGLVILWAIVLRFHDVIPPLIIASLIAYVLTPIVHFVTARTRIPRGVATVAVYLLFFGVIVWAVSILTPRLLGQIRSFQFDFREIVTYVEEFFSRPLYIGSLGFDLAPVYDELAATLTGLVQPLATQTVALLASLVNIAVELLFVAIVSFYLTMDGPKMVQSLTDWIPPRLRYDFERLREEIAALWRAFFRGQLLVAVAMGLTLGVLMTIVGDEKRVGSGIAGFLFGILVQCGAWSLARHSCAAGIVPGLNLDSSSQLLDRRAGAVYSPGVAASGSQFLYSALCGTTGTSPSNDRHHRYHRGRDAGWCVRHIAGCSYYRLGLCADLLRLLQVVGPAPLTGRVGHTG